MPFSCMQLDPTHKRKFTLAAHHSGSIWMVLINHAIHTTLQTTRIQIIITQLMLFWNCCHIYYVCWCIHGQAISNVHSAHEWCKAIVHIRCSLCKKRMRQAPLTVIPMHIVVFTIKITNCLHLDSEWERVKELTCEWKRVRNK